MKLIVQYETSDGCTWSYDHLIPIEYESEEALAVDLEEHCKIYMNQQKDGMCYTSREAVDHFKTTGIYASHLVTDGEYYMPRINTLEKWWEGNHV